MSRLFAPRDLGAIAAIAAVAFVIFAIFAWTERTDLVDPQGLSTAGWSWRLWQIGPLVIAFTGVWWVWLGTRRVPWVRSLALGILALVVFINAYTGLFGDYWGDVWRTVNPLFIASCSVSAVALWRCGCAAGKVSAAIPVALGAVLFANAYFINNGVVWQIMDPVRTLTEIVWAAAARYANVAEPAGVE